MEKGGSKSHDILAIAQLKQQNNDLDRSIIIREQEKDDHVSELPQPGLMTNRRLSIGQVIVVSPTGNTPSPIGRATVGRSGHRTSSNTTSDSSIEQSSDGGGFGPQKKHHRSLSRRMSMPSSIQNDRSVLSEPATGVNTINRVISSVSSNILRAKGTSFNIPKGVALFGDYQAALYHAIVVRLRSIKAPAKTWDADTGAQHSWMPLVFRDQELENEFVGWYQMSPQTSTSILTCAALASGSAIFAMDLMRAPEFTNSWTLFYVLTLVLPLLLILAMDAILFHVQASIVRNTDQKETAQTPWHWTKWIRNFYRKLSEGKMLLHSKPTSPVKAIKKEDTRLITFLFNLYFRYGQTVALFSLFWIVGLDSFFRSIVTQSGWGMLPIEICIYFLLLPHAMHLKNVWNAAGSILAAILYLIVNHMDWYAVGIYTISAGARSVLVICGLLINFYFSYTHESQMRQIFLTLAWQEAVLNPYITRPQGFMARLVNEMQDQRALEARELLEQALKLIIEAPPELRGAADVTIKDNLSQAIKTLKSDRADSGSRTNILKRLDSTASKYMNANEMEVALNLNIQGLDQEQQAWVQNELTLARKVATIAKATDGSGSSKKLLVKKQTSKNPTDGPNDQLVGGRSRNNSVKNSRRSLNANLSGKSLTSLQSFSKLNEKLGASSSPLAMVSNVDSETLGNVTPSSTETGSPVIVFPDQKTSDDEDFEENREIHLSVAERLHGVGQVSLSAENRAVLQPSSPSMISTIISVPDNAHGTVSLGKAIEATRSMVFSQNSMQVSKPSVSTGTNETNRLMPVDIQTSKQMRSSLSISSASNNELQFYVGDTSVDPDKILDDQVVFSRDKLDSSVQINESLSNFEAYSNTLDTVDCWSFDLFRFASLSEGKSLQLLSQYVFQRFDIYRCFDMEQETVLKFVTWASRIEKTYRTSNPYHTSVHAADVLHATFFFASQPSIRKCITDMELLALFTSAIIHDAHHPGVSNPFIINTNYQNLAILYNDKSPLENHHCAVGFAVMSAEDCNWIEKVIPDKAKRKQWRDFVVELVLSTDLGRHFGILAEFRSKTASNSISGFIESLTAEAVNGVPLPTQREDRLLLSKILIKVADVSNPSKRFDIYSKWLSLVMEEFWRQGDREKELGLPISPFMDRSAAMAACPTTNEPLAEFYSIHNGLKEIRTTHPPDRLDRNTYIASSQLGFTNLIVSPLFDALETFISIPELSEGLRYTKEKWQSVSNASASKQQ